MTEEEIRELHDNVGGALAQLTERGALTSAHLSGVEACLQRAHVLTAKLLGEQAPVEDPPEKRAYVAGLLHHALAAEQRRLSEATFSVSCQQGDVIVHPFGLHGSSYRLRLERLIEDEPF